MSYIETESGYYLTRAELVALLIEQYGPNCPGCKRSFTQKRPTIDHRTPLSRGGGNELANLWLLCDGCNRDKADLTIEEWEVYLAGRGEKCCKHKRSHHKVLRFESATKVLFGACTITDCVCAQYRRPDKAGGDGGDGSLLEPLVRAQYALSKKQRLEIYEHP